MAQWQAVMLCGDLVKRRGERTTVWDTYKEGNRQRIRFEILHDGQGWRDGVEIVLTQMPSRTDPAGERRFEKGLVIDRTSQSL